MSQVFQYQEGMRWKEQVLKPKWNSKDFPGSVTIYENVTYPLLFLSFIPCASLFFSLLQNPHKFSCLSSFSPDFTLQDH